ncbi:MAG: GGDEF domain-containing protein [Candidatus Omnitrophica bacterium]|nr:GGDEF domain-containing protein [Candidatus Omnitrophota bacterium]MBU4478380.1 GGDEF domain-containing protein [Candidatus Omnitrophota bacterium]MCG2703953.1 GGDEF domain-containing protein [Candidatus Omnitrophota bacterium]
MDKLIFILPLFGGIFLALFWIINPLMGPLLFVVTIPFLIVMFHLIYKLKKAKKELLDVVHGFQGEKEEIIREIQKKEKRQQEHYEQLWAFGKDLSMAFNKYELLRLIVERFGKATQSASGDSQCFLLSHDEVEDDFVYEVGSNFDSNTLKKLSFSAKEELLQIVIRSRKISTYISDIFGGDSNVQFFLKEERISYLSQLGSLALIPLVLEDNVWGIVVIFCREDAAARIKNEEGFFLLLVAQASIALGSAIHRGLAAVDRLTQLYNRAFFQKRLKEEIEFCNRQLLALSLMMIDVDFFKNINDTYGHQEGDMVLKKIAQIITKNVRLTDVCARYGGDEFVVVLPGIYENPNDKFSIAERLRQSVQNSDFVVLGEKHVKLTISIGVTVRRFPEEKDLNIDELLKRADDLLYKAKNEGRNRVCYSEFADTYSAEE